MKRTLTITAFLASAAFMILGCSSSGAEIADGGVTMPPVTNATASTSVAELPTDEASAGDRARIAGDLQYAMPTAERAAEVFMPGISGEYAVKSEQPIGMDQQLWPWASGFVGGWERSYEMTTDVAGPERRIAVTSRVLMFESEELAIGFGKRLVDELGRAVEFVYDNETTPLEFTTSYKVPSDRLAGKSGAGSVYGSLMVWTTFEDSESSVVWLEAATNANVAVHAEIVKKYPNLKD
jgi:hypothetical protein